MTPYQIFVVASSVVLLALVLSLVAWIAIVAKTKRLERSAAGFFVVCFGLYTVGQALALLQSLEVVAWGYAVPSICYALAAVLFAVGSGCQLAAIDQR